MAPLLAVQLYLLQRRNLYRGDGKFTGASDTVPISDPTGHGLGWFMLMGAADSGAAICWDRVAPHSPQNLLAAGFSALHLGQRLPSGDPHSPQNRFPSELSASSSGRTAHQAVL